MRLSFSKLYFKLLFSPCLFNVSYCCCKEKTSASQTTPDKGKSKGNKSTGGGNPDNPTAGHGQYDDKKLSDIVCTGEYNKVEPSELNNHKEAIFKCLMITAYGWDKLEAWKILKNYLLRRN